MPLISETSVFVEVRKRGSEGWGERPGVSAAALPPPFLSSSHPLPPSLASEPLPWLSLSPGALYLLPFPRQLSPTLQLKGLLLTAALFRLPGVQEPGFVSPALPLPGCVTWGTMHTFSVPHFPRLESGG